MGRIGGLGESQVFDLQGRGDAGSAEVEKTGRRTDVGLVGDAGEPLPDQPPQPNPPMPPQDGGGRPSDVGGVEGLGEILAAPGGGELDEIVNPGAGNQGETSFYDMTKTADVHRVVEASLKDVRRQLKNVVNGEAKIAFLQKRIDALADGDRKSALERRLNELRSSAVALDDAVDEMTDLLACRRPAADGRDVETDEQRETRQLAEIDDMRVNLRNFRSDFDAQINRKSGVKSWFARRATNIGNFFTTTRNRFFGWIAREKQQYVPKTACDAFAEQRGTFEDLYGALLREVCAEDAVPDIPTTSLDEIGDYMASVADMIEAKTEDSVANMCYNSVKTQLRNIAENGGHKLMVLEAGVGFGFHFTDTADATVGVKGKYVYRVFGRGDGSVTVEHVGEGGLDAHATVRVGDVLQADGKAEGVLGGGASRTFRDLDSATRSVFSFKGRESKFFKHAVARFNPLFVKGRGLGQNFRLGMKYLGAALTFLPKLAARGVDALHRLRTGHHLLDCFDAAKQYTDRGYFALLRDRGTFTRADRLLAPRKNVVMTQRRTFGRGNVGAEVDLKAHLGFAHLRTDHAVDAGGDFNAKKTQYRTYMTYLTNEENGQCLGRLLELSRSGESLFPMGSDDLERRLQRLLAADPADVEGGAHALSEEILDALRQVIDVEDGYGGDLEGQAEAGHRVDYRAVADDYRKGMLVVAALLEKLDELEVDGDADLAKTRDELGELAKSHFENPAVSFPEDVFQEQFFVAYTTADGKKVVKHEHVFEYDVLGDLKTRMLGNTALADDVGSLGLSGEGVGRLAGRVGAKSAVEGASKALGLQGHVGVTVTTETPTGDVKGTWGGGVRKTYDLRFWSNITFDAIMRHYVNALCAEAGIPRPEHGNWKEMLTNAAIGAAASAGLQAFKDMAAKFRGQSPDGSMALADQNFVNGGYETDFDSLFAGLDVWRTGRSVQFEFLDGRLSAVSFGNGEKFAVNVAAPVGPVVIRGAYQFDSLENRHSFWMHPSFDALLDKCDATLGQGNRTQWKMFAQRNQAGFARMADVYMTFLEGGGDEPVDQNAADDRQRMVRLQQQVEMALSPSNPLHLSERVRTRLEQNQDRLRKAEDALRAACRAGDAQAKMLAMRTVLELTVRHFDILQSPEEFAEPAPVA